MNQIPSRTRVAIIGGGPAGALLACLLHGYGIDSVIIELRSRDHVLGRIRAGVIEYGSARLLRETGLGKRMDEEGFIHEGVNLAFDDKLLRIDFKALTGKYVVIYGQTQLQKDLYDAVDHAGIDLVDEAGDIEIRYLEGPRVTVAFNHQGRRHNLDCDFAIGCDGAHGTSRRFIPDALSTTFERNYPFVWVGVLSATPPVSDELIYANHDSGFALCSMRNENLSRYYVQGSADDLVGDWPDDRFWATLQSRLPRQVSRKLVVGPSLEKLVTPLRSWVAEPMSFGRLFLAGDVAHVVPPTGAKGLNLAISDVAFLAEALAHHYDNGSMAGLEEYSSRALARVWKAVRFSWWMTTMMHRFPGLNNDFDRKLQRTELEYLYDSENAQRALAENYVGLDDRRRD